MLSEFMAIQLWERRILRENHLLFVQWSHWSVWQCYCVCVCVCVCCIAGVIQGFLWVHRLQVVLVLQKVQQFQVVQPLPSPRALLEDPVSRISELMDAMNQSVKANSILNNSTHKVLKSDPRPLTFFPGSPPIPGGPDSPGSPCGAQQYIL